MFVAAPLLTAASTGVVVREFLAADTQSDDYPLVQAPRLAGRLTAAPTSSASLSKPRRLESIKKLCAIRPPGDRSNGFAR